MLLLMHHDMYEDEEDEFGCGRAYAGSRVCVVSSARYDPALDEVEEIDRLHSWPASHCEGYISKCCSESGPKAKGLKTAKAKVRDSGSRTSPLGPLEAAVSVYRSLPVSELSPMFLSALWLGRTCRTAAHELGHCFGMDHCVYYACSMQGTGSIREDARQPPYLCPVDLAKLLHETKGTAEKRYQALLDFCERPGNKGTHFFAPFAAWLRGRMQTINPIVDLT
jgi:archaemetzincin